MKYKVVSNSIRLASGQEVAFERRPLEVADTGTVLIVVLDPTGVEDLPENVYGVDTSGRVRWRVQRFDFAHGRPPYTGVNVSARGVTLYNRSGVEVLIDPLTGRVLDSEFTR